MVDHYKVVERLKQQARKLKRESMLTHTEALDQVAQNAGFNHWRHVTECHQHIKPAETALKQGCVLLFDQKEIYETELGDDDLFIQDELLEIAFQKTLYEPFINFTDEDDPEGRPLKETESPRVP